MSYGGRLLLCVVSGLVFCTAANAITGADNRYESISERNVFGLKPPPPPPDPEAAKPPPVKITLTGITTIIGKRALLKTPPPSSKPGEPSKGEQSYILAEGQREGDIEVLEIDEKAGSVKVKNGTALVLLTFEKDGPKLPSTPLPAALPQPGVPLPAAGGIPAPVNPANPAATHAAGAGFTLPQRNLRTPVQGTANPTAATGYGAVPGLPTFNNTAQAQLAAQQQAAAQQPAMSPEQQMLMMEVQREANKNNPKFPPLPPTALTPGPEETTVPTTPAPSIPPLPGAARGFPPMPQ